MLRNSAPEAQDQRQPNLTVKDKTRRSKRHVSDLKAKRHLSIYAGAVVEQVQRASAATIGDAHVLLPLAAAMGTKDRHVPIQPDQPKKALHESGRLSQRHAEQHNHRQTCLDRGVAEALLPTPLPARPKPLHHVGIKPDRQRSPLLQRFVIGRPVSRLVLRRGPTAHASQLSCWIHAVNPLPDLRNKAILVRR